MKLSRTLGVLLVLLTSLPAAQLSATLITFNSRISFTQFAPGLPVESFASLNPGNGNISVCDSPLHDSSLAVLCSLESRTRERLGRTALRSPAPVSSTCQMSLQSLLTFSE